MRISELLEFDDIVIQCHDNPDADALASGFAILKYLLSKEKNALFAYSGRFLLKKSNLTIMTSELKIPVFYAGGTAQVLEKLSKGERKVNKIGLLVTADSQYGQGNLSAFEAENVATIDHHQISGRLPAMNEVRPFIGSCSTIVWDMLRKDGFDVNSDEDLPTALYYGLMTDTNNFAELHHPLDRDMQDSLKVKFTAITRFRNSNISKDELGIAGDALKHAVFWEEYRIAMVAAKPCDPNILGIISDMALEVDSIGTCLVYSLLESGVKISVRSCIREVKANEMAAFISEGVGNGGGHIIKAGGFMQREMLEKKGVVYDPEHLNEYLMSRVKDYFRNTEIIDCANYVADLDAMKKYRKKNLSVGYIAASDIANPGTDVTIRTLEGDVNISITEDMYIMIGIRGEIYPIKSSDFENGYEPSDEPYVTPNAYESRGGYKPIVKNLSDGRTIEFLHMSKSCVAKGGTVVFAKELDHTVKLFTSWDYDNYYLGKAGDFLVVNSENRKDLFIDGRDIFLASYECLE